MRKKRWVVLLLLAVLPLAVALTGITINNPAQDSIRKGTLPLNATTTGNAQNTTFLVINQTGAIQANKTNTSQGTEFVVSLDTTTFHDGTFTINATARNASGTTQTTQVTNVTFDNAPPSVTSVNANESTVTSNEQVNISATVTDATTAVLLVNASAGNNVTLTDGNNDNTYDTSTNGTALGCGEGTCTVTITAYDAAQNRNDSETTSFTVDDTPPGVTLNSPGNAATLTNSPVNFNWTPTDNIATTMSCDLRVDNTVNTTQSVSNNTATNYSVSLNDGTHLWNVTCRDDVPNTNTSVTNSFTLDTTPPTVNAASVNETVVNSTRTIDVSANVTDVTSNVADVNVSGDGGTTRVAMSGTENYTVSTNASALGCTEGTCTITFYADDTPGNLNDSETTDITVDDTPPTINSITVGQQDTYYSYVANDTITLFVNATDGGPANIKAVSANFANFKNGGAEQLSQNGSGLYTVNYTPDWNTFNTTTVPVTVQDNASLATTDSTFNVTVHNLTTPRGAGNPCFRYGNGTTNFSQEQDFSSINLIMHAELNGSSGCYPPGANVPPWTGYNRIGTLNFTSLNLTDPTTSTKLAQIGQNININPKLPGNFNNSRIFVNTTFLASLDSNATLTLYDLPFRQQPAIIGDNSSKLLNTTWDQGGYDSEFGSRIGNLTFNVKGFSEYNATDNETPIITPVKPVDGENISNQNFTFNVTLNGTGTGISNSSIIIDSTQYNRSQQSCTNASPGSDTEYCTVNVSHGDGVHNVNVTAWDYGGSAPGNKNTTLYNFTTDTTPPAITAPRINDTVVQSSATINVSLNATDATLAVENVSASGGTNVSLANSAGEVWNVSTTASALGCSEGTCTVIAYGNDTVANIGTNSTTITVDDTAPNVTAATVNDSLVTPTDQINLSVNATDGITNVTSVTAANSSTVTLTQNSPRYTVQTNASALGCTEGTCTVTFTATDNVSNTNSSETVSFDVDNTSPTFNSVAVADQDTYYSYDANDTITLSVNVTDQGPAAIRTVKANFSDVNNGGTQNLSVNGSGLYTVNYTPEWNTLNNSLSVPLTATDNTSLSTTNTTLSVNIYNLTMPQTPPGCFRFGDGTTNFSQVPDFTNVNLVMHAEINGTEGCKPGPSNRSTLPPWDRYNRVGTLNFTSVNLASNFTILNELGKNINIDAKLPGTFGNTRIFVNATFFASLDTNTTLTLYDLPFRSEPAIVGDNNSKLANVNWAQGAYNSTFGSAIGNLTFNVTGFSEYNATDNETPTITPETPTSGETLNENNFTYNVTLNGTGTGISNATVIVDNTTYNEGNLSCTNVSQGSDTEYCTTNVSLDDGEHTFNVTAWDYGGSAPGNKENQVYNATIDTGQPTLDSAALNDTIVRANQTNKSLYLNATTSGNLTTVNVSFRNTLAMQGSNGSWNITTNASALGCTSPRTCRLTIAAIDNASNEDNTTINLSIAGEVTGNSSTIQGNKNLSATINGSSNLSGSRFGLQEVNLSENNETTVSFSTNFSATSLNLSAITVNETKINDSNTITVNGVQADSTKTVYMNETNTTKNGVCIRDAPNADPNNVTSDCSASTETALKCTSSGNTQGQYTCTVQNNTIEIQGLTHSTVKQYDVPSNNNNNGGSSGGGGGGGGGGGAFPTGLSNQVSYPYLPGNVPKEVFVDTENSLSSVTFTPTRRLNDVTLTFSNATVDAEGTVLDAFSIDHSFSNADVKDVSFSLSLSARQLQGVTPTRIKLYRQSSDGWEELNTTYETSFNGYTFTANGDGLSTFALGTDISTSTTTQSESTQETDTTDTDAETEEPTQEAPAEQDEEQTTTSDEEQPAEPEQTETEETEPAQTTNTGKIITIIGVVTLAMLVMLLLLFYWHKRR